MSPWTSPSFCCCRSVARTAARLPFAVVIAAAALRFGGVADADDLAFDCWRVVGDFVVGTAHRRPSVDDR